MRSEFAANPRWPNKKTHLAKLFFLENPNLVADPFHPDAF